MNILYFETLNDADLYVIDDSPFVSYCAENTLCLYCDDDDKMIIIDNNLLEIIDKVDVVFNTLNDANGYVILTAPWSCYIKENKQRLFTNDSNLVIVIENNQAILTDVCILKYNASSKLTLADSLGNVLIHEYDNITHIGYVAYNLDITQINELTFIDCTNLISIEIPNSVISINNGAFLGCSNLTAISIPDRITRIENNVFCNCLQLISVDIPNSVISIGQGSFKNCVCITSVTIPNNITSIGLSAFEGCIGLTTIDIPDSVVSIGDNAFRGCSNLISINLSNSITYLGAGSFKACLSLESIKIPSSINRIMSETFSQCVNMYSITLSSSIISIESYAFESCVNLVSIDIPNSVTSIGTCAFLSCVRLTSIIIPNSVISIGEWAFRLCSTLVSIDIPNSITVIPRGCFYLCGELRYVNIPNTITDIKILAFSGCRHLLFVKLPASILQIGDSSFQYCIELLYIICENTTPPTLHIYSWLNVPKSIPLYVPAKSISAYQTAAYWSKFTNIQVIPEQLPEMVDLGLSVKWAKYNLGVDPTDLSTATKWYGNYYAWGEVETKSVYSWATYAYSEGDPTSGGSLTKYTYSDGLTQLISGDDVVTATYGIGYIIPTIADIQLLINGTDNEWVTDYNGISGLNGCKFMKKSDHSIFIFIPAGGYFDGAYNSFAGSLGVFWSSSLSDVIHNAQRGIFGGGGTTTSDDRRCYGQSIRLVLLNQL